MPPAEELYRKNLALEAENEELRTQVEWYRRQMFGRKSEKLSVDSPAQEKLGLGELAQAEAETTRVSYERRRPAPEKRPMPAEVFANLPVTEILEILPEEVKADPEAYEKISEERTFEVDLVGPTLVKREIVRPKFRKKAERQAPPVVAPALARVAIGGYASAGLISYVVISKYQHHLPLYAVPGIKGPMPAGGLCRAS